MRGENRAVTRGGRTRDGSRLRARAESAVLPFPRSHRGDRLELIRLAPSGRSILAALVLVLVGVGLYGAARGTSAFAIRAVAISGAPPAVVADVRAALSDAMGKSLVTVDAGALDRRVEAVPTVAGARFDRDFPHTLRIVVVPEEPVAVARQGAASWLVSRRGRVMATLAHRARPGLPRVWLGADAKFTVGDTLPDDAGVAVRSLGPVADTPLPERVASARAADGEITLQLRSGLEVRLGDASQLPLKLAVAAQVLPKLPAGTAYLDVAVPDRPVAGQSLNSQVQGESSPSTTSGASG